MTAFVQHSPEDRARMLAGIGVASFDDIVADVPASIRVKGGLPIPEGLSEPETLARMSRLARRNVGGAELACFAGGGTYDVCVPAATKAIASRPEFATAYTPYQAEVSQGTLQTIYEFQTIVTRLTDLDLANASMYDAATALAEAVLLAQSARPGDRVLVSPYLHPNHRRVLDTLLEPTGVTAVELPARGARTDVSGLRPDTLEGAVAVVMQQPNWLGALEDMRLVGAALEGDGKPLFVASIDLSSLALLEPPGGYGADIAVGDAQSLGVPMSYGGPSAGVFAAKSEFLRRMPGRIAGLGRDARGQRAFTLAFQTREQHIRRARATSNICTNQGLIALRATIYLSLLGKSGLKGLARANLERTEAMKREIREIPGLEIPYDAPTFNEFVVRFPRSAEQVAESFQSMGVIPGLALRRYFPERERDLLVCVTELNSDRAIDTWLNVARGL
ncbi:MAG: aminomethyl-transferring glycine dehydrogenase subunit GcvPA [Gemmatimonadetes bacterium]|nr:aminomethyl-transferring glycine dehydrogenase subunit GcvPA [Gemmatimonadota bacterium]